MVVTLFPIATLVKPVQEPNAKRAILITLLGMVTLVKMMQP